MLSSLYSGISGLQANSNAISVVGNNIANSNTIGFKSSSTTFADLLYQNISSGSGSSQVGRGTTVSTVSTNFAQGSFQTTESATDLAIGGDGFFIVKNANSETAYFTRAGQFAFDKEGYLTNGAGYVLQGWPINATSNTRTGVPTDIVIPQGLSQPKETEAIEMTVNLQATTTVKNAAAWTTSSTVEPDDSDYSSSLTVYDSLGQSHIVNVYFRYDSTDSTTGNATWQWAAVCDDCTTPVGGVGNLTFDTNGLLLDDTTNLTAGTATFVFPGGDSAGQAVEIEFGSDSGGGASTQYQSASTTTFQTQDGYAPGELESISVSKDGTISGHYSNGQILYLYQITLANFNNPNGLHKEGGNLFTETIDSGVAYTNSAGSGALGGISANSLEQSNVDLATEFVNLITCQRGYQANSRVITTTDQMLDELMNLKR